MGKKIIYYFLLFILVISISFISISGYLIVRGNLSLKNFEIFIKNFKYNLFLVDSLIFFLFYISGVFEFKKEESFYKLFYKKVFSVFIVLTTVSFIEFFIFFTHKLGRVFYSDFFFIYTIFLAVFIGFLKVTIPKFVLLKGNELDKYYFFLKEDLEKIGIVSTFNYDELDKIINFLSKRFKIILYYLKDLNQKTAEILLILKLNGLKVLELNDFLSEQNKKVYHQLIDLGTYLKDVNNCSIIYLKFTRFFSISLSIFSLITVFPFGFILAIVNKIFAPGRIFYIQERVGENGKIFKLIKFRTMIENAEKDGPKFSEKDDPRITFIGKIMRRLRLDEIPQFINVLNGEMNIVGPRPERPIFVDELSKKIPYYKLRLLVKPGITGWAQVKGSYAGNNLEEHINKLEYDLYYIKNRNIIFDFIIFIKTIKTVFNFKGK